MIAKKKLIEAALPLDAITQPPRAQNPSARTILRP